MTESSPAVAPRRALGAYYTPADVASTLATWALRGNVGPVLDPSYGPCRFLTAALDVLRAAGARQPERDVHGIDVDAAVTEATTQELLGRGARPEQFVHRDFFAVAPDPMFAAVVGNPPYVRHHWQHDAVKRTMSKAMREVGLKLSRRASLWAPFVVHADRFVRDHGRMAMLLPGAAIQADYATTVWAHLARRYAAVTLIRVGERVFPDALEETVVLFARDRHSTPRAGRQPLVHDIASVDELASELEADPTAASLRRRGRALDRARTDLPSRRLRAIAADHHASARLGDVADVRIGIVTGANAFFLRTPTDALIRELSCAEVRAVVPGSSLMMGASWELEDERRSVRNERRCWLMCLDPAQRPAGVLASAISAAEADRLDQRSHCARRDPWWAIDPGAPPDAFLAYMSGTPKGLVVNHAGSHCINGVHRVAWKVSDGEQYLLSTWTSLWALAVEQGARHYAGGVLKLEPGKVPSLPVVRHDDPDALTELDRLLRTDGVDAARRFADRRVLRGTLAWSADQVDAVASVARQLSARRSPRLRLPS